MVNSEGEQIDVINSSLEDDVERDLDWAADIAVRALEKRARIPLIEQMKSAFKDLLGPGRETSVNQGDYDMDKEQFEALSGKVNALTDGFDKLGETIGSAVTEAIKPLTEALNAQAERDQAKAEEVRNGLINKLVEAKFFDDAAEAEGMTEAALNKLVAKLDDTPGTAAQLNGAFTPKNGKRAFSPPKAEVN